MSGYKAIENGVVLSYKTIEDGVVGSYKTIENKFINAFLTADDGSVQEETDTDANEQTTAERT